MEKCRRVEGLIDFIASRYDNAAEIGIGHFPDIAFALVDRGINVFATDILPFHYRELKVIVDDITRPDLSFYERIDLIYSMRPPPELLPYMARLAKTISADLIIKPLSSEYADGWRLIQNRNTTFFLINNCHLRTLDSINVIPACLESFSFNCHSRLPRIFLK